MTQIQNQMDQFGYEAEERNPTYINFIDNKEYEPVENTEIREIREIRIEAYNNLYNGNNFNLFEMYEEERLLERNNGLQEELSRI